MDIYTRLVPGLPYSIKGFVIPHPDGYYCVYINEELTYEEQKRTYEHEIEHIRSGDLCGCVNVSDVEWELA